MLSCCYSKPMYNSKLRRNNLHLYYSSYTSTRNHSQNPTVFIIEYFFFNRMNNRSKGYKYLSLNDNKTNAFMMLPD